MIYSLQRDHRQEEFVASTVEFIVKSLILIKLLQSQHSLAMSGQSPSTSKRLKLSHESLSTFLTVRVEPSMRAVIACLNFHKLMVGLTVVSESKVTKYTVSLAYPSFAKMRDACVLIVVFSIFSGGNCPHACLTFFGHFVSQLRC